MSEVMKRLLHVTEEEFNNLYDTAREVVEAFDAIDDLGRYGVGKRVDNLRAVLEGTAMPYLPKNDSD